MDTTFYTIPEISALFKISAYSVGRMIRTGKLSACKIGREWRITDDDISEYLKKRTLKAKKQIA